MMLELNTLFISKPQLTFEFLFMYFFDDSLRIQNKQLEI